MLFCIFVFLKTIFCIEIEKINHIKIKTSTNCIVARL